MLRSDFYYDLPEQLIAQHPCDKRDHSRLMYLNKTNGDIFHYHFYDIIDLLNPGDCLILNDSRVIPARLYGNREDTGTQVELLLLNQKSKDIWEEMCIRDSDQPKTFPAL